MIQDNFEIPSIEPNESFIDTEVARPALGTLHGPCKDLDANVTVKFGHDERMDQLEEASAGSSDGTIAEPPLQSEGGWPGHPADCWGRPLLLRAEEKSLAAPD